MFQAAIIIMMGAVSEDVYISRELFNIFAFLMFMIYCQPMEITTTINQPEYHLLVFDPDLRNNNIVKSEALCSQENMFMGHAEQETVTQILLEYDESENPAAVAEKLYPLVYDELRALADKYLSGEKPGHTLQPTALVNEAYLRLVDQSRVKWQGKTHFYAVCAQAMKRILIDHARGRRRAKRGGGWKRVTLNPDVAPYDDPSIDLLTVHDALEKLTSLDPRQAHIVELRFFAGLTVEEVAHELGVSKRTVENEWTHAKAWLRAEMSQDDT
jgi:RNA polymerase sigma factor (TIGR02999 family)